MTEVEIICRKVAARTGVSVSDLRGPSRVRKVAHARQRAMWAIRQLRGPDGKLRFSQPLVGNYFGGRDHATVTHAERVHPARRQEQHGRWRGRSRYV